MRCAFGLFVSALSLFAGDVERVGTITDPELKECSGIAASRKYPDVFWAHTDGKKEDLFALNRKGATIATFKISGAKFRDWEDITLDANNNLYVADTGNNDEKRTEVAVYQFPEPNPQAPEKSVSIARRWTVRYPGPPRDCESIIVNGTNVFLISKVKNNLMAEVYSFTLQDTGSPITMKSLARLAIDSPVTSAALSPDGKTLAALSKDGAFFFPFDGQFSAPQPIRARQRIPHRHDSTEGCTFVPEGLLVTAESREIFLFKTASN